eukprot:GHVQ01010591.1.p1 GENE.GHVQ01010591.1~~GHVQ01010591.1.p1  ORF type:complete len:244 (-),score=30.90 GHVQ01010591.1:1337-2068(-)
MVRADRPVSTSHLSLLSVCFFLSLLNPITAPPAPVTYNRYNQPITPRYPVTAVEERDLFSPSEYVFDLFGRAPNSNGDGGTIRTCNVSDLPSLKGQGLSYTLIRLEPCGLNPPHSHPRATEIDVVLEGDNLLGGFAEENGGGVAVIDTLRKGQVTFIPFGLIHFVQNMGCYEAVILAAFNNEDPGVVTTATQLFTLPNEALEATFAMDNFQIENIRGNIPAAPAEGQKECLKRCGLLPSNAYH